MLPGRYQQGTPLAEMQLTHNDIEAIYDKALLPAVRDALSAAFGVNPATSPLTHWPSSFRLGHATLKEGSVSSRQLPVEALRRFDRVFLRKLRALDDHKYRGAFFYHEIQGVKLATSHNPSVAQQRAVALNQLLQDFDRDSMNEPQPGLNPRLPRYLVDVALELSVPNHVVQWRTAEHASALHAALPNTDLEALKRETHQSAHFDLDVASMLPAVGGCRFDVQGCAAVSSDDPVVYVSIYCTDKELYYNKSACGIYRGRYANELLAPAPAKRLLTDLTNIGGNFLLGAGAEVVGIGEDEQDEQDPLRHHGPVQQAGAARIEVRVPLQFAQRSHYRLPNGFAQQMLCVYPVEQWW